MMNLGQLMAMPEIANLMAVFTQPAQAPEAVEVDPSAWKTLGDILALNPEDQMAQYDDESFAMTFRCGGKYWLVKADFTKETREAMEAVSYADEDWAAKQKAILENLAVKEVTDIATLAPAQEELDQWIGKTGQDMLDAGWEQNGWHSEGKGLLVIMINGSFQYDVSFGDTVETPEWGEELKCEQGVVESVTFAGPSYNFSADE